MNNQKTIVCAFCKGTGDNPHFSGSCPVCKGSGKNQIRGKFVTCQDCRGSGQKSGTTLTCYTCGGLGVAPDVRREVEKARKEIKKAREEMEKERPRNASQSDAGGEELRENDPVDCFCQSCAAKVKKSSTVKVCLKCLRKMKDEGEV